MSIKEGRVAIVTGAGQGIGEGVAKRLAQAGAYVVVADIKEETAQKVVDEIVAAGGVAIAVAGDCGMKADADRIVQTAVDKWGTVDILVNNAGINRDAIFYKMTEQQWDDVIRVNLKSCFLMTQACYWPMRNQKYGRIISMSSSACRGNVGQANYASTKAAIIAFSNTIAMENAKHGITSNVICPGAIDTPMARSVPAETLESWKKSQPTGRLGTVDDIAEMVLYFASEEASYTTGQHIWVDGAMQTGLKG
ncbi:MAG: SDR family oxidoreductase [Firmicutes bacterium]|nr:SDR family oxidoreductase [Bacillota bacterium]